jgi:hypothetical protein
MARLRRCPQMGKLAHVITGPAGEFLACSETLPGAPKAASALSANIGCSTERARGSTFVRSSSRSIRSVAPVREGAA